MAACEASEHEIQSSSLTLAGLTSSLIAITFGRRSSVKVTWTALVESSLLVHLSVYMPATSRILVEATGLLAGNDQTRLDWANND